MTDNNDTLNEQQNIPESIPACKPKILCNGQEKCSCKRKQCERFGDCEACIEHHKTHKRYPLAYCIRKAEKAKKEKGE